MYFILYIKHIIKILTQTNILNTYVLNITVNVTYMISVFFLKFFDYNDK